MDHHPNSIPLYSTSFPQYSFLPFQPIQYDPKCEEKLSSKIPLQSTNPSAQIPPQPPSHA
ncbi:hypothetical protein LguiA_015924 [Lonicera macranthoides]